MKISENYMITEIAGETAAIPVGQKIVDMSGALKLNEAASFILALEFSFSFAALC